MSKARKVLEELLGITDHNEHILDMREARNDDQSPCLNKKGGVCGNK